MPKPHKLVLGLLIAMAAAPAWAQLDPILPADQLPAGDGPKPAPYAKAWELRLDFVDPRRIEAQDPRTGRRETFWYMVYTVTNVSSETQDFFPLFELVTQDLRVIDTDKGIPPVVFNAIRERHKQTHKYLVHPVKAIGPIRVGAGNAIESVAIWRDAALKVNEFRIYVAGLSGETLVMENPTFDPEQPEMEMRPGPDGRPRLYRTNPRYFTLRKTLELAYEMPGSDFALGRVAPNRVRSRWIMR